MKRLKKATCLLAVFLFLPPPRSYEDKLLTCYFHKLYGTENSQLSRMVWVVRAHYVEVSSGNLVLASE